MFERMPIPFVTPAALQDALGGPGLAIVDGSWHLPGSGRDGRAEFEAAHIPGAVFFDIDRIVAPGSSLPHMMPPADVFAAEAGRLGISESARIVVYDGSGLFAAPRVAWMFRRFGARDVALLAGGFPRWRRENRPVSSGESRPAPARFTPAPDLAPVADRQRVAAAIADPALQVVDARPVERFEGRAPEPRPGLRPGHIPGSRNLPFASLIRDGELLPPEELRAVLEKAGVDPARPAITSCGSGVSAAIAGLAITSLGGAFALYDGSYAEWGAQDGPPVETGPGAPRDA